MSCLKSAYVSRRSSTVVDWSSRYRSFKSCVQKLAPSNTLLPFTLTDGAFIASRAPRRPCLAAPCASHAFCLTTTSFATENDKSKRKMKTCDSKCFALMSQCRFAPTLHAVKTHNLFPYTHPASHIHQTDLLRFIYMYHC